MKNKRIFLIDDSPDELEALTIYFRNFGFDNIFPFHCPFEALDRIASVHPEIVITDFQMIAIDGISVANQIAIKSPLTKVIIYTGIPEIVLERTDKFIIVNKGNIESLNNLILFITSQSFSYSKQN